MIHTRENRRFAKRSGKIGCFTKLAIVVIALIAFFFARGWVNDWRDAREEHRALQNLADADQDLRAFAEEHLPALQRVVNDFEDEIARRESMLDTLRTEMRRLNRDPDSDPDYRRWSHAVDEMRGELAQLRERRADAYLAFRKFELNPDSADDAEARNRRFQLAQSAATEGRAAFERLIREAEASK